MSDDLTKMNIVETMQEHDAKIDALSKQMKPIKDCFERAKLERLITIFMAVRDGAKIVVSYDEGWACEASLVVGDDCISVGVVIYEEYRYWLKYVGDPKDEFATYVAQTEGKQTTAMILDDLLAEYAPDEDEDEDDN